MHFLIIPRQRKKPEQLRADLDFCAVGKYKSDFAVPVDDGFFNHHSPNGVVSYHFFQKKVNAVAVRVLVQYSVQSSMISYTKLKKVKPSRCGIRKGGYSPTGHRWENGIRGSISVLYSAVCCKRQAAFDRQQGYTYAFCCRSVLRPVGAAFLPYRCAWELQRESYGNGCRTLRETAQSRFSSSDRLSEASLSILFRCLSVPLLLVFLPLIWRYFQIHAP